MHWSFVNICPNGQISLKPVYRIAAFSPKTDESDLAHTDVGAVDCCARSAASPRNDALSNHLEIFALLPFRDFGLKALDLGVLDVDVVVDEASAQRLAEEGIVL